MKKFVTSVLVISLLAMTLVGCGSDSEKDDPTPTTAVTEAPTEGTEPEATVAPTEGTEPEATTGKVERGTWEGNVYTNTFANLKITAPEDWTIFTDAQLDAQGGGANKAFLDGDNYKAEIVDQPSFTDMICMNVPEGATTNGSNFTILFLNVPANSMQDITVEQFLEASKEQLKTQYESAGYKVEADEKCGSLEIGGESYTTLKVATEANGIKGEQMYVARYIGDYMVYIVVSAQEGDSIDEFLKSFESLT